MCMNLMIDALFLFTLTSVDGHIHSIHLVMTHASRTNILNAPIDVKKMTASFIRFIDFSSLLDDGTLHSEEALQMVLDSEEEFDYSSEDERMHFEELLDPAEEINLNE